MKKELSDAELNTYARQIVLSDIGYDGQLKLRNATACIVGLGGLGSLIAPTLVGMGIGQLRLVEKTCARDGQRNFVITATERIDLDLSLLGRTLDEMGFSIKTSWIFTGPFLSKAWGFLPTSYRMNRMRHRNQKPEVRSQKNSDVAPLRQI